MSKVAKRPIPGRVLLYSVAAPSRVYWLQGYFEARPQDVAQGYYQRRMERDGSAFALSAAGEAAGGTWAAYAERGTQEERQHPPGRNDPASDTWNARGWTGGLGLRRAIGARVELVVSGRYSALSGEARRGDLPDTVTFYSHESVLDAAADVAWRAGARLDVAGRVTFRREDRQRHDQLALLRSDIESWTTGFGAALAYRPFAAFTVSAGGAFATYGAAGAIPDPTDLGVAFVTYVEPELALEATDARTWAVSGSVLWRALPAGALWARVRRAALSPGGAASALPSAPIGRRAGWAVELGVVVGR